MADGRINQRRWSEVWTAALLAQQQGAVWVRVDSTTIERPEAETSPERGLISVPNLPQAKRSVSVGWQVSTVMLRPSTRSSWGALLAHRRITSEEPAISGAIDQWERVRSLVPARTRILADRCYATGPFVAASPRLRLGALLRLKRHRKGYRKAPPPGVGKRGAPRKDGDLFQGSRPQPWGEPAAIWPGSEKPRRPVTVQAWQQLHCRQARQGVLTVYRVRRQGATGSRRDPRERWFVWGGQSPLPLAEVVSGYQRRFSHEHTYRFRHRKICSRRRGRCARHSSSSGFCVVVAPAMNHLVVARSLAQACYRRL